MNRTDGRVTNQIGLHEKWDPVDRTDGQFVYHGVAAPGIASDQEGWLIEKCTFTTVGVVDIVTDKAVADGVAWDSRTVATYR